MYERSRDLFERSQHVIPGGVNSPVRAFRAVGGTPVFFREGKGAWLGNEKRLRVAARTRLDESLLGTGVPFIGRPGHGLFLKELHQISQRVTGVRRFGAAALDLAWVAAGRLDGFWERNLSPWDVAAGFLLVT